MPQPEEVPRQRSRVAESLWDNSDFIQAGFNEFYSSLKTTSDQIDVSTSTTHLIASPYHDFDSSLM
jgi:hypothetical protein